jgi:competence protein ComEC
VDNSQNGIAVDTRITVNTKLYPRYSYGDEISLIGRLNQPRNFGDANGRSFDYVHYLSKDGIFYVVKSPIIKVLATGKGNPVVATLFKIKQSFLGNIYKVLGEPHAALAAGLVVGEKTGLGKDLLDDFRKSGLIHIVILSGYSINIIANSIRGILSFLPRSAGLFSGGLGIVLFGILVGARATVVRACTMALISIFAQFFYRDYNALRALLFTAYIMILQNPYIVPYDASFQVSFTATLGLILMGRRLDRIFSFLPERFGVRAMVISTMATQIAVFPLLLYMMGDASVVGVFANLAVLPLIPLMMLAVFLTGALGFFSIYLSYIASGFSYALLSYTLMIVQITAHIPYSIITVQNFSIWMMWAAYGLYAAIFCVGKFKLWKLFENLPRSPPS